MRLEATDAARMWDMLDAARAILEFTHGLRFESSVADRKTRNAVERCLEILGEAARGVSASVRDRYPDIQWRAMIALRNLLAHEYGDIRFEVLWTIITRELPPLIQRLVEIGIDSPPATEQA
jgi:uncharacterized protein with HEPN domain